MVFALPRKSHSYCIVSYRWCDVYLFVFFATLKKKTIRFSISLKCATSFSLYSDNWNIQLFNSLTIYRCVVFANEKKKICYFLSLPSNISLKKKYIVFFCGYYPVFHLKWESMSCKHFSHFTHYILFISIQMFSIDSQEKKNGNDKNSLTRSLIHNKSNTPSPKLSHTQTIH